VQLMLCKHREDVSRLTAGCFLVNEAAIAPRVNPAVKTCTDNCRSSAA